MDKPNQHFVQLTIKSDVLSGSEIHEKLRSLDGRHWERGDRRPTARGAGKIETRNGWILESELPSDASLEEHVQLMMRRVRPSVSAIADLARVSSVQWSCIVYASAIPSLYFKNELIEQLAAMHADFDIDLYLIEAAATSE